MTATTQPIVDFILARIAEDEAAATGASHHRHLVHDYERDNYGFLWVQHAGGLAECEAKRRIVAIHTGPAAPFETTHVCDGTGGVVECETLCALASVYADHPDYREEWAL